MVISGKMEMQGTRQRGGWTRFHAAAGSLSRRVAGCFLMMCLLMTAHQSRSGSPPVMPEYQVKALFLLNFAKYVEWPSNAFASPDAPLTIGLLGEDKISDELHRLVKGRTFGNRPIVVRKLDREEGWGKCQILFISASEKSRLGQIAIKVSNSPVLTVGECDQFLKQGGMINFVKKEGKIRLEIELDTARRANLQISSKLLSVADVVHGKF